MKTIPLLLPIVTLMLLFTGCTGLPGKHTLRMDDYEIAYAQHGAGNPAVIFEAGSLFNSTIAGCCQLVLKKS